MLLHFEITLNQKVFIINFIFAMSMFFFLISQFSVFFNFKIRHLLLVRDILHLLSHAIIMIINGNILRELKINRKKDQ